jgi:bifunctional DNA-binding transcriptional regulator/antitoxin component of YhaV-PrlF toxin-antitoxin module
VVVVVTRAAIAPLLLPTRPLTPAVRPLDGGPAKSTQASAAYRRGLPLPEPTPTRTERTVYGTSAVDSHGRVAERAAIDALGWTPGTRLDIVATSTHLTLHAATDGVVMVKARRYLWLPAPTRHRLGLRPGDRVLLAADPERQMLVVFPPVTLDELLARGRTRSRGGEPR